MESKNDRPRTHASSCSQKDAFVKVMSKLLMCKYKDCGQLLMDPVVLPCCNQNICQSHLIDDLLKTIQCPHCGVENSILEEGFPFNCEMNEAVKEMIKIDTVRSKSFETIEIIQSVVQVLRSWMDNPKGLISTYFSDLRNKIDINREECILIIHSDAVRRSRKKLIEEARTDSKRYLRKIDSLEIECKKRCQQHDVSRMNFDSDFDEMSSRMDCWKRSLWKADIDEAKKRHSFE